MNKLFEPIQIGSMTLKNRIVMAPMGTTTDTTNAFNMRDVKYYGERAKGGYPALYDCGCRACPAWRVPLRLLRLLRTE